MDARRTALPAVLALSKPAPNMHVYELPASLLCAWLPQCGRFGRMGVQGEGSCFFHSVLVMLNKDDYVHLTPAKQLSAAHAFRCDFQRKFTQAEYSKLRATSPSRRDFEEEHDSFCVPTVWADEVMIRHAARVLGINLIFLDFRNGHAYCGVHGEETVQAVGTGAVPTQKTGIVAWVSASHFEPIVRIDDAAAGRLTTLFDPAASPEDARVVSSLMQRYMSRCRVGSATTASP